MVSGESVARSGPEVCSAPASGHGGVPKWRRAAPASPVASAGPGQPSPDLIGLERLIGVGNFIDARFLRLGVAVARTVARIVVKEASGWFGYEQDLTGREQLGTSSGSTPRGLFVSDPALDYTLVAVQPDNGAAAPLTGWDGAGSSAKKAQPSRPSS